MRKWKLPPAALAVLLFLAGCRGQDAAQPAPYQTLAVQEIARAGAFSEELEEVDADTAFLLYRLGEYGLEREDMTDCAVLRSAGGTCEEGAVLVLDGEEAAQQAVRALKDYVAGQIQANTGYRPAELPKLEKALVDCRGNTVLLAVTNDRAAVEKALA